MISGCLKPRIQLESHLAFAKQLALVFTEIFSFVQSTFFTIIYIENTAPGLAYLGAISLGA